METLDPNILSTLKKYCMMTNEIPSLDHSKLDLNKLTWPGMWRCANDTPGITTIKNLPEAMSGMEFFIINLHNRKSANKKSNLLQIYLDLEGNIFVRHFQGWSWKWFEWTRIGSFKEIPIKVIESNSELDLKNTLPNIYYKKENIELPGNKKGLYTSGELLVLEEAKKSVAKIEIEDVLGTRFWTATFSAKGDFNKTITLTLSYDLEGRLDNCKWFTNDTLPVACKIKSILLTKEENGSQSIKTEMNYNESYNLSYSTPDEHQPEIITCRNLSDESLCTDVEITLNPTPMAKLVTKLSTPKKVFLETFVYGKILTSEIITLNSTPIDTKKGNLNISFRAGLDVPSNIKGEVMVAKNGSSPEKAETIFTQKEFLISDSINLANLDTNATYSVCFNHQSQDINNCGYLGIRNDITLAENETTNISIDVNKVNNEPAEPDINIGDPYIIDHNYDKEHVMWLGGIEAPKPEDMKPYIVTGKPELDLDENGNVIEGSGTTATKEVPRYYVEETTKNNGVGKADWYNVNKAMADNPADDAMCWAMSAASAVQWWFDKLDNQVDDLFAIRRNKGILDGNSATLVLDDMNGKDVHYTPLPTSTDSTDILNKSGVGQYTRKSFYNMGGDSRDLFRLYFFKENTFGKNNYKGHRALGLLDGMGYNRGPGTYSEDPNEKLWEYVPITNKSRNEIVREFKKALSEGCAVVLHQANIPDDELVEGVTSKAHHAIIAWGVIFDEKFENIVGLYVGDNNIREAHLTRVDLVYKKLSETGGRYYYAWPFVDQHGNDYVKQTSIHTITKLYPPSDRIKNWITTESSKLHK